MPYQSPFHQMHLKSKAEMAEQNGWLVPLHYGDPQAEQQACRKSLAVFDLSHHSRVRVSGLESEAFLSSVLALPGNLPASGRQVQTRFKNPSAPPVASVLLQHQAKDYLLILTDPDYPSRVRDLQASSHSHSVEIRDETPTTAMVSAQGPYALPLLQEKLSIDVEQLQSNDVVTENMFFMKFTLSVDDRNPPGVNLIMPAKIAPLAWDALQKYGRDYNASLAGLEAWKSL